MNMKVSLILSLTYTGSYLLDIVAALENPLMFATRALEQLAMGTEATGEDDEVRNIYRIETLINLAVHGRIARVTVVCQCVCLLPRQMALNCFNSANTTLVATKL